MLQVSCAELETELRRSSFGYLFRQTGVTVQISESCCHALGLAFVNPPFPFDPREHWVVSDLFTSFLVFIHVLAVVSSVGEPIHFTPNRTEGFLLVKFSNLQPFQSCHDPTISLKAKSLVPTRSSSACILLDPSRGAGH